MSQLRECAGGGGAGDQGHGGDPAAEGGQRGDLGAAARQADIGTRHLSYHPPIHIFETT